LYTTFVRHGPGATVVFQKKVFLIYLFRTKKQQMLGTPDKDRVYSVLTSNRAALGKCTTNELLLGHMDPFPTQNIVLYHPDTSRLSYVVASLLDTPGPTGPSGTSGTPGPTGPTGPSTAQGSPGPTGPIGTSQTLQTVTITESGPYTIPPNVISATLVALGGGGGGGGSASGSAAGGGSTSQPLACTLSLQPNDVINVVIGAGGAGGIGNDNDGSQGENTEVYYGSTLLVSSPGGNGGKGKPNLGSGAGASGPFGGGGGGGFTGPEDNIAPGAGGAATGSGTPPLNYGQSGFLNLNGGAGASGGPGGLGSFSAGGLVCGGGGGGGVGGGKGGDYGAPAGAALPNSGAGGGGAGGGAPPTYSYHPGGSGGSGRVTITLLLAI